MNPLTTMTTSLILLVFLKFGILSAEDLGIDIVGSTLPTILYTAVVRGKVALPCDISTPAADDSVVLILWYKGEDPAPIYTLDARRGTVEQARQSAGPQLEGRAFFNMNNRPAFLQVDPVQEDDAGDYRCRVDFRKARTVNTVITLKVIVPPGEPIILDEQGEQVKGLVGPINEGDSLRLTCEATGGKPKASVTWWKEYTLLDDSFIVVPGANLVRNDLYIKELRRQDLMSSLTCQASNNNITVPAFTSVTLDLNLKPVEVRIDPSRVPLSAGREYEFSCTASGSRPSAAITWWKGNRQLKKEVRRTSQNGDITTSIISIVPTLHDNEVHFACRAHNPVIPGSALVDGWKLDIHYVPQVTLSLGSTFKKGEIQEKNDVYFECIIRANPWVTEIGWYLEGQELRTNTSAGVIISNQSLVLQKVRRSYKGHYRCLATNPEGTGTSNEVFLRIRYAPDCKPNQKVVYGVGRFEPVRISCELDADPENVTFRWRFNNSFGKTIELSGYQSTGTRSVISYMPQNDEDYGSISCWGSNDVGRQRTPCLFTIIPAGPPEPPLNCTTSNQTETSLRVDCVEGYSGGLVQNFHIEVYDSEGRRLPHSDQNNSISNRPQFVLLGLPSGEKYRILVYAENAKGKSAPLVFSARTLQKPEKLTGMEGMVIIRPVLGLLIGIVVSLVFVAIAVIVYVKLVKHQREKVTKAAPEILDKCQTPLKKDTDDATIESEEKGPDIIPANVSNKTQVQQQEAFVSQDGEKDGSSKSAAITPDSSHWGSTSSRSPLVVETRAALQPRQQQRPAFRRKEDVTYAELALPLEPNSTAMTMIRRRDSSNTEYAKIDHLQRHTLPRKGSGAGAGGPAVAGSAATSVVNAGSVSVEPDEDELSDSSLSNSKRESAV